MLRGGGGRRPRCDSPPRGASSRRSGKRRGTGFNVPPPYGFYF